jgi:predicted pyridoxine 5'-phosphate oxidase superfamily flavin-nucleotide-binding protein
MSNEQSQRPGSPWHAGERALQRSVGAAERMAELGSKVIRDQLTGQNCTFYPQLPFVVLGTVDPGGDVWATLRDDEPGFMHAVYPYRLHLQLPRNASDPADRGMDDGQAIGLLGIDLLTRRRNRLNGTLKRSDDHSFDISVEQSYGNCPRYIQQRQFNISGDSRPATAQWMEPLDTEARDLISNADSFFVASYVNDTASERQVDVSHRGGKPGFVRLDEDGTLTIPDFAGNLFFNTLGNFVLNPKAGLVFIDFTTGDLLQMTGDVELILDSSTISTFDGAERLWRFGPRRIVRRSNALALRWSPKPDGSSPTHG